MVALSRTSIFAISLCLILIAPWLSARAEDDAPVRLRTGGRILSKKDEQSIGKNCSAHRAWVEVDGLPNAKAESLINTSLRRELTVGKKLTAKDCAAEGKVRYDNGATLSAARDKAIGVETKAPKLFHPSALLISAQQKTIIMMVSCQSRCFRRHSRQP
jgi:hypothetical protein